MTATVPPISVELQTRSADVASARLTTLASGGAAVEVRAPGPAIDLRMQFVRTEPLTVVRTRTQSGASLRLSDGFDGYHLAVPRRGCGQAVHEGSRRVTGVDALGPAGIVDRLEVGQLGYGADTDMQCFIVSSEAVNGWLSARLEAPVIRRVQFDPLVARDRSVLPALLGLAQALHDGVAESSVLRAAPLALASIQEAMVGLIVTGVPHNYSAALATAHQAVATPRAVLRAMDFMQAYAHHPITIREIAAAAQCSVRALQIGFRRSRSCTPIDYLRTLRLQRVREDLLDPTRPASVSLVAMRWGFVHMGMLAKRYREAFGESPSVTLRTRLTTVTSRQGRSG